MQNKNEFSFVTILVVAACIIVSVLGAVSLNRILPQLNGWQAAAYAAVGGIFIAAIGVVINQLVAFFVDA